MSEILRLELAIRIQVFPLIVLRFACLLLFLLPLLSLVWLLSAFLQRSLQHLKSISPQLACNSHPTCRISEKSVKMSGMASEELPLL